LNEGHYTREEDQESHCIDENIMDLKAKSGEAILIHNWLLHRLAVNRIDQPGRAFSVTYMEALTKNVNTDETFPVIFGKNALCPKCTDVTTARRPA